MVDDELLRSLYASVTRDDAFERVLLLLARRFGCRSAVLIYFDPVLPGADIQLSYGAFDEETRARYKTEYMAQDPAPLAMSRLKIGEATSTERLFGPEPERGPHARFLTEFYYPLGLRETLGGPIANENGRFGIVGIHRGPDRESFRDEEIAEFARLMPHIAQAVELRQAFFRIAEKASALDDALEPAAAGVMIFSAGGILTHANAQARAVLARADGLVLTPTGRLGAVDPALDARLHALFEMPARSAAPVVLRVPRTGGGTAYALRVRGSPEAAEATLSVYICDLDRTTGDVAGILSAALGLSPAGSRLVASLLEGEDLRSFALRSGISLNTAKFHLKGAFAATGVSRQADLVRIAAAVSRDLAA